MAPLDRLPADERAVLELVLQRGRTYDQIATLLSVDRAGVRQRALAAFDALGPQTEIPPERRGLIADYLLGQLPPKVSQTVRERLARDPAERAWARVLAAELTPIARDPLPEIPVESSTPAATPPATPDALPATPPTEPAPQPEPAPAAASAAAAAAAAKAPTQTPPAAKEPTGRRSSKRGGAVVLGLGAIVVLGLIAVLIFVVLGGGSTKSHTATHPATASSPASTTTTAAKPIAQVNLNPPAAGSKAKGIAQVVQVGPTTGIVIVAQNVPPNNNNFYAVWLYNSPSDYKIVGYVNPGVGANGQLQTTGPLPTNANHYGQLWIALQTKDHPKPPGPVVLKGNLTLR